MKEVFDYSITLNKTSEGRLEVINSIIGEYADKGYSLTLRQLYYQLVARKVIPNKDTEYSRLSTLLSKARLSGKVDWDAIEDRIRQPRLPYWVRSPEEAIENELKMYRLDRMEGQSQYVEVWTEKDALSGVLYPVTHKYHIRLMVNRGYSSVTAMYDAFNRMYPYLKEGIPTKIIYLGDHDPSGVDMIRDIEDRLLTMMSGERIMEDFADVLTSYADSVDYVKDRGELSRDGRFVIHVSRSNKYFDDDKAYMRN